MIPTAGAGKIIRHRVQTPHCLVFSGLHGLSSGLKRPGLEADYSPPSSAEVKNT